MSPNVDPSFRRHMPRLNALSHLSLASFVVVMTVTIPSFPSAAAEGEQVTTPSELAQTSAVATPFVGTFEVWCTERNPGVSCTNHHRSPAVDVGMTIGTPIYSAGDGTVVEVEAQCRALGCRGGAGLFVEIGHSDGRSSRYLHLDATFVDVDDEIRVGQLIGLSGATGQSSSPHLHYDEKNAHYPFGSRTAFGPWLSCISGEVVQYPDSLGYTDWRDVPFGTEIVNEGYECLGGAALTSVPPLLFSGDERFGLAAPSTQPGNDFQVELTTSNEGGDFVSTVSVGAERMTTISTEPDTTYSVRMRAGFAGVWSEWSEPVVHDPSSVPEGPLCRNFHASGESGSNNVDVLIGTDENDVLFGFAGDDIICGLDGDDLIVGGDGDDRINGDAGHDTLDGGPGRDRIAGGMGRDLINAGDGRDRVNGGAAADEIIGHRQSDVLLGGSGPDVIRGGNGGDRVFGNDGDDTLFGGGGNDRLFGIAGIDTLDGGIGTDLCSATADNLMAEGERVERCEV